MTILEILFLVAAGFFLFRVFRNRWAQNATRDTVVRRVASKWPAEVELVLSELDLYSGPETDRVQMDILALSKGSLEDLRRWVKLANNDYRDVISAAEYSPGPVGSETLREFRARKPPENEDEVSFKDILS